VLEFCGPFFERLVVITIMISFFRESHATKVLIAFGLVLFSLSIPGRAGAVGMTWEEAWNIILQNNPGIKAAKETVSAAHASLKLTAVPTKVTAGLSGTTTKNEGINSSSSAGLTLSYNTSLFGREKEAIRAETAGLREAETALDAAVLRLYHNAAMAFWGAAAGEASVRAAEDEIVKREAFLQDARLRYEQGMVPELDVMRAESALAEARHSLALQQASRSGFEAMLKGLAGWRDIRPAEGLFEVDLPVEPERDRPDFESVARDHPSVVRARWGMERAEHMLRVAEMISLPTLGMSATMTLLTDGTASQQYSQDEWWGRATLTIPVIDGGQARWTTERARAALASAEASVGSATAEVMMNLLSAWEDYTAAIKGFEAERSRFSTVSREREIVLLRYREGLANQIEVLDAQTRFASSVASLINARRGLLVAEAALASAEGKLPMEE
jgi:outer membrane protein TolC